MLLVSGSVLSKIKARNIRVGSINVKSACNLVGVINFVATCLDLDSIILKEKIFSKFEKTAKFRRYVSQAAARNGLIYFVTYNGQTSGMQGYALPLVETDKTFSKFYE